MNPGHSLFEGTALLLATMPPRPFYCILPKPLKWKTIDFKNTGNLFYVLSDCCCTFEEMVFNILNCDVTEEQP